MKKKVLLIATFDTKEDEALFLKRCIESHRLGVLTMDVGILAPPRLKVDIPQTEVACRGGIPLEKVVATGDKGVCTLNMIRGAEAITRELFAQGRFDGVVGFGGAQGTEIGCTAMRALPIGVPRLMVSTVANGQHTFGSYVGTKDITIMHSVADLQGLNFLVKRILENAAGAISGMVKRVGVPSAGSTGIPVAMSMLGTTTPGALHAKKALEGAGFEVVAFHQNGTGGIAMEDMIREGAFRGVLDLNLHEIGDRWFGGLHGAIREDRVEAAGDVGLPQVIAPGSLDYTVQGPHGSLPAAIKGRKCFIHNPRFTLIRLLPDELEQVGKMVAHKLNKARGPVKVFIPLRGFSFADRENLPLWDPAGNRAFVDALQKNLDSSIPMVKLDAHINDPEFIDPVVEAFLSMVRA